jgi:hypothetical protein
MNLQFSKLNQKQFNKLILYLLKTTTSKLEIIKIDKIYNEPENELLIKLYCPQQNINSKYIENKFKVRVCKWSQILTDYGIYTPDTHFYQKEYEYSSIKFELIN